MVYTENNEMISKAWNKDFFIEICERDELIKIGINNGLPLKEIQKILSLSGKRKLYPYFRRDAILLHCISKKMTLENINTLLQYYKEESISEDTL